MSRHRLQLEAVLLRSGKVCINNGLLLKYSSELGSETSMLANIMLGDFGDEQVFRMGEVCGSLV